jgi:hypothetical protein
MRTLPVVLAVVLVNDAVLLLALDVTIPSWLAVLGVAVALTVPILVVVGATVENEAPRAGEQGDVEQLRERVSALEAAEGRESD